jgi:hypothetical protein
MPRIVVAAIAVCALGACAPVAPPPDAAMVARASGRWPDSDAASLGLGHDLYVARCGSCHVLHRPGEYGEQEWRTWVRKMRVKAKLGDDQAELVARYLLAAR